MRKKGRENLLNIYIVGEKGQEEGRREKGEKERGKRKEERKIKADSSDLCDNLSPRQVPKGTGVRSRGREVVKTFPEHIENTEIPAGSCIGL